MFDLVHRLGYIEKVGSGIKRIKRLIPNVKFEITSNWFRIIFKRKIPLKSVEKIVEKTVEKILRLVKDNPRITQKQLSELTGLSRRGIELHIKNPYYKLGIFTLIPTLGLGIGAISFLLSSDIYLE